MTTSLVPQLIGPLTTTYTEGGATCSQVFLAENPSGAPWLARGAIGEATTSCLPSGFERTQNYYYSPGICPTDFTYACSYTTTDRTTTELTKTIATCCPTGYTCIADRPDSQIYGCSSFLGSDTMLTISTVSFATISSGSTSIYTNLIGTTTTSVTANINQVVAYGIIIQRASGDPEWGATTTTTSSSKSSASLSSSTGVSGALLASATTFSSTTTAKSSTGMGSGAKIGLGVGLGLGFAVLALGVFLIGRRIRNKHRTPQPTNLIEHGAPQYNGYQNSPGYQNAPGYDDVPGYVSGPQQDYGYAPKYQHGGELPAQPYMAEIGPGYGHEFPHELPTQK